MLQTVSAAENMNFFVKGIFDVMFFKTPLIFSEEQKRKGTWKLYKKHLVDFIREVLIKSYIKATRDLKYIYIYI